MTTSIRLRKRKYYTSRPGKNQVLFLFDQLQNLIHLTGYGFVILPAVGFEAVGTVLDALFGVAEAAAALISQAIKGAVTEQPAEGFRVCAGVAREIFALLMLEKIVICHFLHFLLFKSENA